MIICKFSLYCDEISLVLSSSYSGAKLAACINICMAANDDNEWLGQRKSLKYVEWAASMR